MKLKPELLYFLTVYPAYDVPAVRDLFRKLNADHATRVNTILLTESKGSQESEKDAEPMIRSIAEENGGVEDENRGVH